LVAETLRLWREAERALDAMPPESPDHETAQLLVLDMQALYAELTETDTAGVIGVHAGRAAIDRAKLTLGRVSADGHELNGDGGPEAGPSLA